MNRVLMKLQIPRNPYLTLTYDSLPHADGIGAQTERIFGIYLWAKKLNLGYYHSGITDLVEPYSNSWSLAERKAQILREINEKILLPNTTTGKFDQISTYRRLNRRVTFLKYLESLVKRKKILLKVLYVPRANFGQEVTLPLNTRPKISGPIKSIVVHIRNAEGRYGVYDRRNLEISYFLTMLDVIRSKLDEMLVKYSVTVLTDIGVEDFELQISEIPKDKLWIYSLTEAQLAMPTITFKGKNYKDLYFKEDDSVEIIQGGDPLVALEIMEKADFLVMSRSSMSSIGGCLNSNGMVIQPPDWIYAKNKRWTKARDLIPINKEWRVARHPILYLFIPHALMNRIKKHWSSIVK
jgi:hypothetical protein